MSTITNEETVEPEIDTEEPKQPAIWARLGAEVIGTFILVFAGLGAAVWGALQVGTPISAALAFGLALVVAAIAFGPVSGGHFNPAVTLGAAIAGGIKWLHALYYVIAQVIGAFLAALILYVVLNTLPAFKSSSTGGGLAQVFTSLANGFDDNSPVKLPLIGAALIEIIATAVFVSVILAVGRLRNKAAGPFAIGLSLAVLLTVVAPFTGGSLNPARSTAVVFFGQSEAIGQLWIFWVAPLAGAALAGLIYRGFIVPNGDSPKAAALAALQDAEDAETSSVATSPVATAVEQANSPASEAVAAEASTQSLDAQGVDPEAEARDFFDGAAKPKSEESEASKEN
ncbi:aquaporin Z [Psychromicrobium silvestre]|uniref:Aquaporin Z n=1 Tax=Psychromicrobium silvestre TaxID=1645614 RepID=A0A7Y9S6S2_9MICC|nr:aquaporin Z [Psychromicrobium silvestre]